VSQIEIGFVFLVCELEVRQGVEKYCEINIFIERYIAYRQSRFLYKFTVKFSKIDKII
jgi:hypothetical protein